MKSWKGPWKREICWKWKNWDPEWPSWPGYSWSRETWGRILPSRLWIWYRNTTTSSPASLRHLYKPIILYPKLNRNWKYNINISSDWSLIKSFFSFVLFNPPENPKIYLIQNIIPPFEVKILVNSILFILYLKLL